MLNSVPRVVAQGGTTIDGKYHARVCEGSTIVLNETTMFRITSAYETSQDLNSGSA